MDSLSRSLEHAVARAIATLDVDRVRRTYEEQEECVFLERFLPPEVVEAVLVPEVEKLRPNVHRSSIPGFKKGGALSSQTLAEKAPLFLLSGLVGARVMPCPEDDPHACALYFYTEPGDHIGFHYDTSYYRGARYTVLMGLIQRFQCSRIVCHLYRGDPTRETKEVQLAYGPGSLVIFNGDKLWHAVTPLAPGEERDPDHGVRDQPRDERRRTLRVEREGRHRLLRAGGAGLPGASLHRRCAAPAGDSMKRAGSDHVEEYCEIAGTKVQATRSQPAKE